MTAPRPCRILLTGFEPFGAHRINSSWEACRLAAPRLGEGVIVALLPVDRRLAAQELAGLLEAHRPRACLLTGLARGTRLRIETRARRPRSFPARSGPFQLRGTWPTVEAALALRSVSAPFRLSCNAGKYVCESTYWALLNFRRQRGWPRDAGFLHVPPLSHGFPAARLARAVEAVVGRRLARLDRRRNVRT